MVSFLTERKYWLIRLTRLLTKTVPPYLIRKERWVQKILKSKTASDVYIKQDFLKIDFELCLYDGAVKETITLNHTHVPGMTIT